jgi:CheY-like chemotaxis protein/signal transduction histidine kinase
MTRFERRYSAELQIAIWLSLFVVFVLDLRTVLGVAVWVFYVIPLIVSLMGWQPKMPIIISAVGTVLTAVGFLMDEPGLASSIAAGNRMFGAVTLWTIGLIGRKFLQNKLLIAEQNWLREGQTALALEVQGQQLLPSLGDKILRFLVRYLNAQVGVIHFRTDDGSFRAFATHAANLSPDMPYETVRPGEGITGQIIRDRRAVVLQDLPEDYMRIASSLGNTRPRHVMASPGLTDGEVEAIIELAFVNATHTTDLRFLELIAESVGTAVRASKYRTRLEYLLQETRRQTDQLQAQGEELRVTNEELEEQGRILKDSQARLEAQQAELEETNAQLEEQAHTLETQKADLTQAQLVLGQRAEELEKASQYKSEFLANMSHELRTPLNSSLILAKLLADNKSGNLTDEQIKFAQTIYSAGNDLLELVNDILDLSKIEAGEVRVQADTVLIGRLADSLTRTFQPVASEKKLEFMVDVERAVPGSLVTDSQRLEQILKNLLSNAIKFTDAGAVTLRVAMTEDDRIAFAVSDTGIGIPKHQQQVIFEAFRQADGSTHRKYGGTGLGLSISQRLASLLRGEILVESAAGHGSTFTLIVPRQIPVEEEPAKSAPATADRAPEDDAPITSAPPVEVPDVPIADTDDDRTHLKPGMRTLLVVEDDKRFADILFDLAHELGFQCIVASTAAEALALAREYRPSAMLLDMHLPDQSGLYVLDRLKRTPATRHIPVHVVSVGDYMQPAMELGAIGYAVKPVKREELVSAVRKLEEKLDQPVRRILVIEDDDRQRESIERLLEGPDVELTAVASAAETLEKLRETTFDCVVMDLGLKDMSGYELLDRMANEQRSSFPPVIIYTGRVLQPLDEQRLRRYSQSIIIKGARSPERLLDEVTLFLHQVESKLPPDQQRMLRQARARDTILEGRRILIVEDDVRNIFALTSVLEPKGAKIEIARTGKEAISAIDHSLKNGQIDLVLMDIMMPEMDGLTAIRHIRARPEFGKLPIIALTAKAMPDDRDQSIAAGANDYISKPLDVDRLLSLIRVWMSKA